MPLACDGQLRLPAMRIRLLNITSSEFAYNLARMAPMVLKYRRCGRATYKISMIVAAVANEPFKHKPD